MSSEMEELTVTLDSAANDSCEASTDTLNHSLDLSDIASIRSEVHRKGLHLSETWTELFNLLGEYQGHLHRKENEIVAKELPPTGGFFDVGANSDALGHGVTMEENCMLKSKLSRKNLVLNQVQEELQTKKRLLGHYQDEMLNKERKILQLQEELRQSQQKSQRLENDLESRNEDLTIKDNLINKIQIQMVKEVGDLNNEVKKLQQCLDRERQRHENHMKQCNFQMNLLRQSQNQNIGPTATLSQAPLELPEVIDITDVDERQEKFQTHESRVLGSSFQTNPHRANVSNCVPTPVSLIPAPSQQVGTVDSGDLGKDHGHESNPTEELTVHYSPPHARKSQSRLRPATISNSGTDSSPNDQTQWQGKNDWEEDDGNLLIHDKFDLSQESPCISGQRFSCPDCGHTFPHRGNLLRHLKTHSRARPYKCHLCDKTYRRADHLKRHQLVHLSSLLTQSS